ncbi:hypothetical protein MKY34_11310 [Sporosarcina sp. FSL K6-1522]|uniref:hypothetical protein n=1 Tax=Sporosarcina sp. FSL K6-1522 TaxID=2921554 RepID=UPI00315B1FFD
MAGNRVISAVLRLNSSNFNSGMSDVERNIRRTGNQIGRFKNSAVSNFSSVAKGVVGMAAAFMGVNAIKDLGVSMVESAASAQAMSAQFEQVFEGMESAAESSLAKVSNETNMLSDRLKGSFLGMAAFAKTTGMDTAGALELTERATLAAADSSAFYDRSIEDVSESLQSFLKGNYANDAALGISATETTRNATANKLYGKSFKKLSEEQKQLTLLQMVEDGNKLSGALGQAAREGDGFENVMGNLRSSWDTLKGNLGVPILGPVVKGMQSLTKWIGNVDADKITGGFSRFGNIAKGAFDSIKPGLAWVKDTALPGVRNKVVEMYTAAQPGLNWMKDVAFPGIVEGIGFAVDKATEMYNFIKDNWSLIGPVVAGVAATIAAFKIGIVAVTAATTIWKGVTVGVQIATALLNGTLLISPLGWVALAIGAVVAVGILLWQNWDTIKLKAGELWEVIKEKWTALQTWTSEVWEGVKTGISEAMSAAGTAVSNFFSPLTSFLDSAKEKWDGLVGAFKNFKMPTIKMPSMPNWMKSGGGGGVDGSHASGLNRVPYDGYVAELHKDEMVVPATQSRNLRKQGLSIDNIDQGIPSVRGSAQTSTTTQYTYQTTDVSTPTGLAQLIQALSELIQLIKNMPKGDVVIKIDGYNKSVNEIVNELIPLLKLRLANM